MVSSAVPTLPVILTVSGKLVSEADHGSGSGSGSCAESRSLVETKVEQGTRQSTLHCNTSLLTILRV